MNISESFNEDNCSISCDTVEPDKINITFSGDRYTTKFYHLREEDLNEIISFLRKVKNIVFHQNTNHEL